MRRWTKTVVFLGLLVILTGNAVAVNLVGDADNSGTMEMTDAVLVQDYLYGVVSSSQISPLALADGDGDIDLADLMLGAQAVAGSAIISGPGSLLSITHPPNPTLADSAADFPVVFGVASNIPIATLVDGLEISISMTPGESMLGGASAVIASSQATATFTPINSSGSYDVYFIDAQLVIGNSNNSATIETGFDSITVTVTAPACGDGVTNGAEACDDELNPIPTQIGTYDTPGAAYDVEIVGNLAYVADNGTNLLILDISTPTPTLVGSYNTIGEDNDIEIIGNYAYIAAGTGGLVVLDLSNPIAPTLAGSFNTSGYAYGVATDGSRVYIADGSSGVQVFSVTAGVSTQIGFYNTPDTAYHLDLVGNTLYVADNNAGLLVLDVSNPTPALIGAYNSPGRANNVHVYGNVAFLADGGSGISILDVSTPNPTLIGAYDTLGYAYDVLYTDDTLYVADNNVDGLVVLDVANLAAPTYLINYGLSGQVYGLALSGSRLFLSSWFAGLYVFSVQLEGEGVCLADCSGIQTCGDGAQEGSESCDDGDTDNCTTACDAICSGPHTPVCGNGVTECNEVCDDGDVTPCGGPCNETCATLYALLCGNGSVDCGEVCDDGDTDSCTTACDATCSGPHTLVCGDGLAECGEVCDDGLSNGAGQSWCLSDCSGVQSCGDGVTDGTEACDDGDTDRCTTACDAICAGPHTLVCGDGVAECGETCDDGDNTDCGVCNSTCDFPGIGPAVCGDGVTCGGAWGESCDDGPGEGEGGYAWMTVRPFKYAEMELSMVASGATQTSNSVATPFAVVQKGSAPYAAPPPTNAIRRKLAMELESHVLGMLGIWMGRLVRMTLNSVMEMRVVCWASASRRATLAEPPFNRATKGWGNASSTSIAGTGTSMPAKSATMEFSMELLVAGAWLTVVG